MSLIRGTALDLKHRFKAALCRNFPTLQPYNLARCIAHHAVLKNVNPVNFVERAVQTCAPFEHLSNTLMPLQLQPYRLVNKSAVHSPTRFASSSPERISST